MRHESSHDHLFLTSRALHARLTVNRRNVFVNIAAVTHPLLVCAVLPVAAVRVLDPRMHVEDVARVSIRSFELSMLTVLTQTARQRTAVLKVVSFKVVLLSFAGHGFLADWT